MQFCSDTTLNPTNVTLTDSKILLHVDRIGEYEYLRMNKAPSSRYLECVHMAVNNANVVANTAFRVKIP